MSENVMLEWFFDTSFRNGLKMICFNYHGRSLGNTIRMCERKCLHDDHKI